MRFKSKILFAIVCLLLGCNMVVSVEAVKSAVKEKRRTEHVAKSVDDSFCYVTKRRGTKRVVPRDSFGGVASLHWLVDNNWAARIRDALGAKDVKANERDSDGNTPLLVAVTKGYVDCVRVLVHSRKVDINAVDVNGNTPLHIAIKNKSMDCVLELLNNPEINIYATNYNMDTIWHTMFESEVLPASIIRKVLSNDVVWKSFIDCIRKVNKKGETPLDLLLRSESKLAQFKQWIPSDKARDPRLPIGLQPWRS